jgi:hypothetical protein
LILGGGAALYFEMKKERAKEDSQTAQGRAFYEKRRSEKERERALREERFGPTTPRTGAAFHGPKAPSIADRPMTTEEAARVQRVLHPVPPLRPDALPEVQHVPREARERAGFKPLHIEKMRKELEALRREFGPSTEGPKTERRP